MPALNRNHRTALRALCLLATAWWPASGAERALDRYVAAPDAAFRFHLVRDYAGANQTTYVLEMTSQRWLTPAEVDRTEWKHWLVIVAPHRVASSTALLFIGGGSNGDAAPAAADKQVLALAAAAGVVAAELRMVPNQPLAFAGDGVPRSEDSLIAFAWDKFLRTGEERWLPRLPMTKAAVRAMDTVTSFLANEAPRRVAVDRFVVAGGSKRGWTTWTTAAVDRRVVAIAPLVIDLLNLEPSMIHHWRAYGFWAPAIADYERMGIMNWMRSARFRELLRAVEPYEYRDRFTMPKLILNAAGDQFFLPDSSQFYFGALPGERHLRYVPNADHSLRHSDALETLAAFVSSVASGRGRPEYSWELPPEGGIVVWPRTAPAEVKLWQATNRDARDFRLETIGKAYAASPVRPDPDGAYRAKVSPPARGWSAYFLELTFPSGGPYPFKFTTSVRVTPDRLPFPPPKAPRPAARAPYTTAPAASR